MSEYSQAISCTLFLIRQSRLASYRTSILVPVWSPLKRCTVSKWKPYILILLTTGIYNIPHYNYYGVLSSFSKDESCSKALSKGLLDSFEAFHSLHNRPSDFAAYYSTYCRSGNFRVQKLSYDKFSCKNIFIGTTPYSISVNSAY